MRRTSTKSDGPDLDRVLGFPALLFYGVGTIIGAGIYSVIGAAADEAGERLWLSFLAAGAAAFVTALSYAELASMSTRAGAEYQFLKRAFPRSRLLAFMAGYLIALNAAATSATVALAFAGYLATFVAAPTFFAAFALLGVCTVVNIAGIRQSTNVSIALICIEVAGLLLVILTGFEATAIESRPSTQESSDSWAGVLSAAALVFFVYIGFEDVANLSEEAKSPKKHVPNALIAAVVITTSLYLLVTFAALSLAGPESLANSSSPLSDAVGGVEAWRGAAVAVAALFATASTALISLISISRLLFGMARDGAMPHVLALTASRRKTPWVAAIALFAAAAALLPIGDIKIVAAVSSFGVLLVFTAVQIAMIVLRYKEPTAERPFKAPLSIRGLPLLPLIGIAMTIALLTQFDLIVYLIGGAAILIGAALFYLSRDPSIHMDAEQDQ